MKSNFYFLSLLVSLLFTNISHAQNKMLTFDGDARVTIPHNNAYDLGTGDFTVEVWMSIDVGFVGNVPILSTRTPAGLIFYVYSNNNLLLQMAGGISQYMAVSTASLHDGQCHHIAATRSGTNVKFYLDGVYKGTVTGGTNSMTSSGPLYFGYDVPDNYYLKGSIDEVRLWNVARSDANILSYYNANLSGTDVGLIGYWTLDETAGQSVVDRSATGNDGVLGSTTAVETSDPVRTSGCDKGTVTGLFDAKTKSDKLTASPNPFHNETNITIDAESANYNAEVYTIEGQLMQTQQVSGSREFQLGAELQPGMYVLKVSSIEGVQTIRIVKK